jgi:hypothetical protein
MISKHDAVNVSVPHPFLTTAPDGGEWLFTKNVLNSEVGHLMIREDGHELIYNGFKEEDHCLFKVLFRN